ncbi:MAG: hypothetical protein RL077_1329 [Verrucomicrobiota bacterium]
MKGGDFFRIGIVDPFEFGAGFEQSVALAVDVTVVKMGGREGKLTRFNHRAGFPLRGVIHAIGFLDLAHNKKETRVSGRPLLEIVDLEGGRSRLGGALGGLGERRNGILDGGEDLFLHPLDKENAVEVVDFVLNAA